jgi:hypothetical protein
MLLSLKVTGICNQLSNVKTLFVTTYTVCSALYVLVVSSLTMSD